MSSLYQLAFIGGRFEVKEFISQAMLWLHE